MGLTMKLIRVPWIVCRADEFGASNYVQSWRGEDFEVMAYSEKEAREWWGELSESERSRYMRGGGGGGDAEMSLF